MHFPMKLYELVETGPSDTVAWSSSGKSFLIVNPDAFCNHILPKHFRHNKLTSFQRQLNLYGFQRIAKGAEAAAERVRQVEMRYFRGLNYKPNFGLGAKTQLPISEVFEPRK